MRWEKDKVTATLHQSVLYGRVARLNPLFSEDRGTQKILRTSAEGSPSNRKHLSPTPSTGSAADRGMSSVVMTG